jgi:hypothetical protein
MVYATTYCNVYHGSLTVCEEAPSSRSPDATRIENSLNSDEGQLLEGFSSVGLALDIVWIYPF